MVLLTMPGNVSCVGSVYHCLYIQSPCLNPVGHILNWGKYCLVLYSTALVMFWFHAQHFANTINIVENLGCGLRSLPFWKCSTQNCSLVFSPGWNT